MLHSGGAQARSSTSPTPTDRRRHGMGPSLHTHRCILTKVTTPALSRSLPTFNSMQPSW